MSGEHVLYSANLDKTAHGSLFSSVICNFTLLLHVKERQGDRVDWNSWKSLGKLQVENSKQMY